VVLLCGANRRAPYVKSVLSSSIAHLKGYVRVMRMRTREAKVESETKGLKMCAGRSGPFYNTLKLTTAPQPSGAHRIAAS
jgi:hypothetical protein